jgi:hypothetical protein
MNIASASSEEAAVHKLQDRIAKLLNQIEVWSEPNYPSDDDAEEVPDLNGVPLSTIGRLLNIVICVKKKVNHTNMI